MKSLVDVLLMSASTCEVLSVEERLFDHSPVTPAVRANDTTDIHLLAGAAYPQQPSRPFRTPTVGELRGRKIKDSEHPLSFVRQLRLIADGETGATEACRAYHDELAKLGITPRRPLAEDLRPTG